MARVRDVARYESQREEILDAAASVFAQQGYDAATMDAVAQRVGLTKAALYYYVPGKAELLAAVCSRAADVASVELLAPDGDYAAWIERFVAGHLQILEQHLEALTVMFALRSRGDGRGRLPALAAYTDRLEAAIRAGVDAGAFRNVDPRLTALAILGMLNWAHRWLHAERRPVDEISRSFTDLLRSALLVPGQGS